MGTFPPHSACVFLISQLIFHKDIFFSSIPHANNTTYGHKRCVQPAELLTGTSAKLSKQNDPAAWPGAHLSRLKQYLKDQGGGINISRRKGRFL